MGRTTKAVERQMDALQYADRLKFLEATAKPSAEEQQEEQTEEEDIGEVAEVAEVEVKVEMRKDTPRSSTVESTDSYTDQQQQQHSSSSSTHKRRRKRSVAAMVVGDDIPLTQGRVKTEPGIRSGDQDIEFYTVDQQRKVLQF